ncbi:MAG: hypothetical protein FWD34_03430 [Oscillospiraceae bacterium]|nr:hypothetical protein [Oscillospiraceae bacterium]
MSRSLKRTVAFFIMLSMAFSFVVTAAEAVEFSETNRDVEIIVGGHVGYQFVGSESNPAFVVDITKIASVKYFIKVPEDLEHWGVTEVHLIYNSETTGWVADTHDLNDGLIIEIEICDPLPAGDYFEAIFGTWDDNVTGTVSFEVYDSSGEVLGTWSQVEGAEDLTPVEQSPPTGSQDLAALGLATALSLGIIIAARRKKKSE